MATKLLSVRKKQQYLVAVCRAVLEIASTLNVAVVAEGIETSDQHEIFRSLDCPLLQGHYFCKPMPAAEITVLLHKLTLDARPSLRHIVN